MKINKSMLVGAGLKQFIKTDLQDNSIKRSDNVLSSGRNLISQGERNGNIIRVRS